MSEQSLGEGTKKLGFGLMRLPQKDGAIDLERTKEMVDRFLDAGCTYFDTAWAYAGSEEAMRRAASLGMCICEHAMDPMEAADWEGLTHVYYGNGKGKEQIALWGMRLSFAHPITKEQMLFIAPVPEEKPWLYFERELRGLETIWPQIKPVLQAE